MRKIGLCPVIALLLFAAACPSSRQSPVEQAGQKESMPQRDINDVLRNHDKELMAIPGVVGVYAGLLPDDQTPCLKVMVVKKTRELEKKIPKFLEGYPVVIEESGVIHPLKN
jgi:hypothetical protein